jgi:hypothetical protein
MTDELLFVHRLIRRSADYVYPNFGMYHDYKIWGNIPSLSSDTVTTVKPNSVIFTHAVYYMTFSCFSSIEVPFLLITWGDDFIIPYGSVHNKITSNDAVLENKNLIRWFAANADYTYHPKLQCIPIGIPNSIPWIGEMGITIAHMAYYGQIHQQYSFSAREQLLNNGKKLLHVKYTLANSRANFACHQYIGIRVEANKHLRKIGLLTSGDETVSWEQYINELRQHKFCLSLPGRGLDCYRTWEALSLGVIPIVLKTIISPLYENLPVLQIDNITDITVDFLTQKYKEICQKEYDWNRINLSYWVNKIRSTLAGV